MDTPTSTQLPGVFKSTTVSMICICILYIYVYIYIIYIYIFIESFHTPHQETAGKAAAFLLSKMGTIG